jgi:hypothetical protein
MYILKTYYFPKDFVYLSPVVIAGAVFAAIKGFPVLASLLLIAGLIFPFTYYVTKVDRGNGRYSDYLFLLGLQLNKEESRFSSVQKIIITKSKFAYNASTRSRQRDVNYTDFTARLIFADGRELDVLSNTSKRELLKKLVGLAAYLQVEVEDHCSNDVFLIDLERVKDL